MFLVMAGLAVAGGSGALDLVPSGAVHGGPVLAAPARDPQALRDWLARLPRQGCGYDAPDPLFTRGILIGPPVPVVAMPGSSIRFVADGHAVFAFGAGAQDLDGLLLAVPGVLPTRW